MEKTNPKTVAERQTELKARRKAAGFRQLNEWVHDDDREGLALVAKAMRVRRWRIIQEIRGEK